MPARVLIADAGRHGSTAEVAHAIAEAVTAADAADLASYDAVVVGSAVYFGKWLPEAVAFIERHREALQRVPVAYFTTCLDLTRPADGAALETEVFIDPALGQPPKRPDRLTRWERMHLLTSVLQAVRSAAPDVQPVSIVDG